METMVPKLVAEDIPLLNSLLSDVFPGVAYVPAEMTKLREEIAKVCREMYLVYSETGSEEIGGQWVEKVFVYFMLSCHIISKTKLSSSVRTSVVQLADY
jgi:dynein heavy chain 1, cytosolic